MKRLDLLLITLAIAMPAQLIASPKPTTRPSSRPSIPWAPRADCTGIYGHKSNQKAPRVGLAALFKSPHAYKGKLIQVSGVVADVCRKKGCWLLLKSGKQVMRVRFKGYSFFVPTNSKGYKVTVTGYAAKTTIPEHIARHYAEESGDKSALKKIKGPQQTVSFMADWVSLRK